MDTNNFLKLRANSQNESGNHSKIAEAGTKRRTTARIRTVWRRGGWASRTSLSSHGVTAIGCGGIDYPSMGMRRAFYMRTAIARQVKKARAHLCSYVFGFVFSMIFLHNLETVDSSVCGTQPSPNFRFGELPFYILYLQTSRIILLLLPVCPLMSNLCPAN